VDVRKFLQQNVIPVTGCTEPASIAYATSVAFQALSGCIPPDYLSSCPPLPASRIIKIEVATDGNVYKNTRNAIVPGTNGQKGPAVAAAAGIFLNPRDGLDLFSGITPEIRGKAMILSMSDRIVCGINDQVPAGVSPDIRVRVMVKEESTLKNSSVRIYGRHNHIAEICIDDIPVYTSTIIPDGHDDEKPPDSIVSLIRIAESMSKPELDEVYRGVAMNMDLLRIGMHRAYGLGLGSNLRTVLTNQKGILSLIDKVRIAAAVAADARMGGAPYPVMSSAGSGNMGITALIPVGVIGQECRFSQAEVSRAALISHMVTKLADRYTGHLSALCGCSIKAGIGATAGVTYLIGGDAEEITTAINLMVANITGTICDGAKPGCTLKIATATGVATECAFLAAGGMKIPLDNGIIQSSASGTIHMLEKISRAMMPVDAAIIKILEENQDGAGKNNGFDNARFV
jgi:L-cysteine desulfidase